MLALYKATCRKKRCIQFQTIYSTLETYRKLDLYAKQSDFVIKMKKTNTVRSKSAEIHWQTLFNNNNRPYATNKSKDSECATNKANYDAFCSDSMDSKLIYLLNVALVWLEKIETLNIDWTLIAFRMNLDEKRKKMQTKWERMERISMIKHLVKQVFGCERFTWRNKNFDSARVSYEVLVLNAELLNGMNLFRE